MEEMLFEIDHDSGKYIIKRDDVGTLSVVLDGKEKKGKSLIEIRKHIDSFVSKKRNAEIAREAIIHLEKPLAALSKRNESEESITEKLESFLRENNLWYTKTETNKPELSQVKFEVTIKI